MFLCSLFAALAEPGDPALSLPNAAPLRLLESSGQDGFRLVADGRAVDLYAAPEDFPVVRIAADCLAADIQRVTDIRPLIKGDPRQLFRRAVLIGTMGKSPLIDDLIRSGKLAAKSIAGQWESFVITTVANPFPGMDEALVIAGSDRRGTAFGVFTLSETIGVSPWVWWADVAPRRRTSLTIAPAAVTSLPPSVKYRGIFINDEDWGLQPWAAKTFEPETGDIGPKTYAKVCELLLRLKANYLWPAMHPCTRAFNLYPRNKIVADEYGIVMGSSHCEQMLRNNVSEYDEKKLGPWDYDRNRDSILAYWKGRLEENGPFENTYAIGMRGIHDGGMPGGGGINERAKRLQRVIDDQRDLIATALRRDPATVPQIFCPYKEVLELYEHGLKVPDDVTLVWPDDNHGYIRRLPDAVERKRAGGSGVYYHISYWGGPEDYLWLCTTPPALIWEEMHKAFEQGARTIWVLNVGDIKPGEIAMEFFLRMAWDIGAWEEDAQPKFLTDWAARTFGPTFAGEIAAAMDEYYRLNFPARPEHLHLARFTANYDEIGQRLRRFAQLVEKVDAISTKLPVERRDSFYELVAYPVRGSALANEMHLSGSPERARRAYEQIQAETRYYNEELAGGKWQRIISSNPRNRPALRKPEVSPPTGRESKAAAVAGFVSFEAEHPARALAGQGVDWKVIKGLGRSGDSIALLPTTSRVPSTVGLEYDFIAEKSGPATVLVYCLPTHAISSGTKVRYAACLDSGKAEVVDIDQAEFSTEWSANVLRGAAIGTVELPIAQAGRHTLKLQPLDPGIVFDKVVVDFGGLKPSHLGPPATSFP